MEQRAKYWIEKLGLEKHPEGGHYRVTYRSKVRIDRQALPPEFKGDRSISTAIYFLLDGADSSALHRIKSDEMWHFYEGSALVVTVITAEGTVSNIRLGRDPDKLEVFQATVPAGCWFSARLADPSSFALVGCTVSPGFDFEDFELACRADLTKLYPQHQKLISEMTRG